MARVTVAAPKISYKPYKVSGETLKDVEKSIKSRMPAGSDEAGSCRTGITPPAVDRFDPEEVSAIVDYTVAAKAGLRVSIEAVISLPDLTTRNKLSPAAQKEWDRFLKALTRHEMEHVAAAQEVAEDIARELGELRGEGTAKDKAGAIAAAEKDFIEKYRRDFAPKVVEKRVTDAHRTLDARGNTFTLDVTIS